MWLATTAWAPALCDYLEQWTEGRVVGACGTDDATLLARQEALHDLGFTTEIVVQETAYTIDVA